MAVAHYEGVANVVQSVMPLTWIWKIPLPVIALAVSGWVSFLLLPLARVFN